MPMTSRGYGSPGKLSRFSSAALTASAVGVAPVLVEQLAYTADTASWLAARIREIEARLAKLEPVYEQAAKPDRRFGPPTA